MEQRLFKGWIVMAYISLFGYIICDLFVLDKTIEVPAYIFSIGLFLLFTYIAYRKKYTVNSTRLILLFCTLLITEEFFLSGGLFSVPFILDFFVFIIMQFAVFKSAQYYKSRYPRPGVPFLLTILLAISFLVIQIVAPEITTDTRKDDPVLMNVYEVFIRLGACFYAGFMYKKFYDEERFLVLSKNIELQENNKLLSEKTKEIVEQNETISNLLKRLDEKLIIANKEKSRAELAFLKTQINPHFLFNSLNGIYSLSLLENSEKTSEAILKLSSMMRFILSNASEKEYIDLHQEISYIEDYLTLQKLRLGTTASINYVIEGEVNGNKIAPFLLIPFVENAFKYGVNPEKESKIKITIRILEKSIQLEVLNGKVADKSITVSNGLGIENTKQRLAALYQNNYLLKIDETDDDYTVLLEIQLS